jgi:hypothetical protein
MGKLLELVEFAAASNNIDEFFIEKNYINITSIN